MEESNESQDELNLPEESLNHSERTRQRRAERVRILRERRSAFSHHCHIQRRRIHEQQVQEQHAEQQRMARSLQSVEQRRQIQQQDAQQHRAARSQLTVVERHTSKIALQPVTNTSVALYTCGTRSHVLESLIWLWMQLVSVGTVVRKGIEPSSARSPKILSPTTRIGRLSLIIKESCRMGTDQVGLASHRRVCWSIFGSSGRQMHVAW